MSPSDDQPTLGGVLDGVAPPVPSGDPDADVVSVLVETPLAHLDRPFDYLVPPSLAEKVAVGSRVRVRFAGRELGGFVLSRTRGSDRSDLAPLKRAVSAAPVLPPRIAALCRRVALEHGGTTADVVRLAVPSRHATTEASVLEALGSWPGPDVPGVPSSGRRSAGRTPGPRDSDSDGDARASDGADAAPTDPWRTYAAGEAFLRRIRDAGSPGAVVQALPGRTEDLVVEAAVAAVASGRRVLVVAPTSAHVDSLAAAFADAGIPDVELMRAEDGTARRYRAFVRALTGQVGVVIGTRSAAFAPLPGLGLVVLVEDGDDRLAEPHAPYPHARDVLLSRHADPAGERAAMAIVAVGRTVAAQHLVRTGVLASLAPDREAVRGSTARVAAPNDVELGREGPAAAARIPHVAWTLIRDSLEDGPVLVQVARAGYVPALACARCRESARCRHCHGPLGLARGGGPPSCRWCGRAAADFRCDTCGGTAVRAVRIGAGRTSHELGRAFPGVPVLASGAGEDTGVARTVDDRPRLVVATPGAEPVADGGYRAAVLLDGGVATARPGLGVAEEALRRWLTAASLVRPAPDGGRVLLLGRPAPQVAQALVRWDPVGFAERELAERAELALPPATRAAVVRGGPEAVRSFLAHVHADPRAGEVAVLGPVPIEEAPAPGGGRGVGEPQAQAVLRSDEQVPLGPILAAASAARSARKEPGSVRVELNPQDLL
jgi:primosomal protein N' (replication factor Y)